MTRRGSSSGPWPPADRTGVGSAWASLGAAVATLLCCVLPSVLVLLGLGTTVAALTSAMPWLVTLSRHKGWVFLGAGVLIVASRLYQTLITSRVTAEGTSCPTALGRWTRRIWGLSAVLYATGVFTVYVLGPLLLAWDR